MSVSACMSVSVSVSVCKEYQVPCMEMCSVKMVMDVFLEQKKVGKVIASYTG